MGLNSGMSNTLSDNKQTHATRVFTAIESKAAAATSMVAASWARSVRLHGLLPDGARPTERHGQSELSQRQERLQRVLHVSGRTLDRLYSTIALSGCGIFLCDSDGVVLERLTSDGGATEFDSSGLSIGADWSEASQGTNGIGTCIAEGRAVSIQREQHFIASNIAMSCMGAPIFDAQGALAAVLDISSCRADIEGPVVQLIAQAVSDAAGQIEADHFCDFHSGLRILRGAGDRTRSPVLLAVDADDLVVGATLAARKQFGLPLRTDFTPKPASDVLGDSKARGTGFESAERRELRRAIARADGNMSEAARALGVSRSTLYRRASKLGLVN